MQYPLGVRRDGSYYTRIEWASHTESDPTFWVVNLIRDDTERNECLGVFLSQGRVSMKNVEKRRQLPADDPHHLDDAGVRRLEESQKHPDEQDMARARSFLCEHLGGFA